MSADDKVNNAQDKKKDGEAADLNTAGDPGRTPGSAEGEREDVDASLRKQEREGKA